MKPIEKVCKFCRKDFFERKKKDDTEGFYSDESIGHDFRNYVVNVCHDCKKLGIKARAEIVGEGRCPKCGIGSLKNTAVYELRQVKEWDDLSGYWEDKDDDEEKKLIKDVETCTEERCKFKRVIKY